MDTQTGIRQSYDFRPSFLAGFWQALDLFSVVAELNAPRSPDPEPEEGSIDEAAMSMDVKAVMADFWFVIDQFEQQNAQLAKAKERATIPAVSQQNSAEH